MERRTLLKTAALLATGAAGVRPCAALPTIDDTGWRRFAVTTEVDVAIGGEPVQLWLPLAATERSCQRSVSLDVTTDGHGALVEDGRYGASILKVEWDGMGPRRATVTQVVDTRPRGVLPGAITAAEREFWLQPSDVVPTDGIVAETARRIVAGRTDPGEVVRAIYDWVVDNTFRDGATRGCGTGDIKQMLETGWLGGKCADINTLMTGLARASGIPARDFYGIRVASSSESLSLGASGDVTKAQHCRCEMFIDGRGWLPVDPADVRKVVLEEKVPIDSDHARAQRERLFGSWEMNWVGFNHATGIVLPGALRPTVSSFLMYPCAMTAKKEADCLDPQSFCYRITAREVTS